MRQPGRLRMHAPCPARILLAAATVFALATPATAISVSITDVHATNGLENLVAGDEVAIEIVYSNANQDPVAGLGIEAFGWNTSILRLANVEVTESIFNEALASTPSGYVGLGGLQNIEAEPFEPAERDPGYHQLFNGISITPTIGTNGNDVGLSGGLIAEGDIHARVTFVVLCGGSTTIQVGGVAERGDVEVLAFTGPPSSVVVRDTNLARVDLVISGPPPEPPGPVEAVEPDPPVEDEAVVVPPVEDPAATDPTPETPPIIVDLTRLTQQPGQTDPNVYYTTTGFGSPIPTADSSSGLVVPEPTTATFCLIGLMLMGSGRSSGMRR